MLKELKILAVNPGTRYLGIAIFSGAELSSYPELSCELEKEKRNKNPYHLRMFEAVALGATCFHQLDK